MRIFLLLAVCLQENINSSSYEVISNENMYNGSIIVIVWG